MFTEEFRQAAEAAIGWAKNYTWNAQEGIVPRSADSAPPTATDKCGSTTCPFPAPFCEGYSFAEREAFRTAVEKMLD